MYQLLRNIHLALGLAIAAFMFVYAASAFRMGHYFLFRWSSPTVERSELRLESAPRDPRQIVESIRAQRGMRGDLYDVETSSTGLSFLVRRPGTEYRVTYTVATHTAEVFTSSGGFWEMIDKMHHTGGRWHDDPLLSAWGTFVGVMSALLLVVALSGVWMWFKRHRERRLGGILLTVSMVVSVLLLVIVRLG